MRVLEIVVAALAAVLLCSVAAGHVAAAPAAVVAIHDLAGKPLLHGGLAPPAPGRELRVVPLRAGARLELELESGETLGPVAVLAGARPALDLVPGEELVFAEGRTMNDAPRLAHGAGRGAGLLALSGRDGAIAIGAAASAAELTVSYAAGALEARFELGGTRLASGRRLELALIVARGADLAGALEAWVALAAGPGEPPRPRRGWCSWYASQAPDQRLIESQLPAARELGLEVIQIDDGWQVAVGEWQANARFPGGMAELAGRIRAQGLVPGIWLAPFAAAESSAVVREHPDWVLRDASGAPVGASERAEWGGRVVRLDPSRPGVVAWLEALAARVTRDWGFGYVKLDFLHWGISAERHDHGRAPLEAWREALAAMRLAMAPGSYLLGCDAPLAASVGLFDAMRIGPDSQFEAAREATVLASSLRRLHWRRAFALDPDAVWVGRPLPLEEAQARAQVPALLGGAWFSGDRLEALDPERRALVRAALAASWLVAELELGPGMVRVRARLADGSEAVLATNPEAAPAPLPLAITLRGRQVAVDPLSGGDGPVALEAHRFRFVLAAAADAVLARDPMAPLAPIPIALRREGVLALGPVPAGAVVWLREPLRCPAERWLAVAASGPPVELELGP